MTTTTTAPPPRPHSRRTAGRGRPRRTREELRDLILESAREILMSEGLGTGAEHLSFKRVLTHVEATRGIRVTNASVIGRIWDNQQEFQSDVINAVADIQGDAEAAVTMAALTEALDRIDVSTPELRRASLAELIRVACGRYLAAASTSAATVQKALVGYVAASQTADADNQLIANYRIVSDRLIARYEELYALGLSACGWRLRDGFTMHEVATLVSAVAEGILMHQLIDPDAFVPIRRESPLDGWEAAWTQHAIVLDRLVEFYCEPDPDWRD